MSRAIAAARPSIESAVVVGQLPTRQSRKRRRPKLIDAPRQSSLAKTTAIVNCPSARPPRLIQIDAPFSSRLSRNNEPLRRDRRKRLDTLQAGDGRLLPDHLKAQVRRVNSI